MPEEETGQEQEVQEEVQEEVVEEEGEGTDWEAELETLRKENRRLNEDVSTFKKQVELYRSMGTQMPQQQQQQPQQAWKDPLADYDENDVLTTAQVRKALSERDRLIAQAFAQMQRSMQQQQIKSQYDDFMPVMQEMLAELQTTDPAEAQRLLQADDITLKYAYEAFKAKKAKDETPPAPQPKKNDAERKAANLKKPQFTGEQAGGGAISSAQTIKDMSDEDFKKFYEKQREKWRGR